MSARPICPLCGTDDIAASDEADAGFARCHQHGVYRPTPASSPSMSQQRGDRRIEATEAVAAIESAWNETCCGNRNEDVCESCRAYADAIRAVKWVRDRATTADPTGPDPRTDAAS